MLDGMMTADLDGPRGGEAGDYERVLHQLVMFCHMVVLRGPMRAGLTDARAEGEDGDDVRVQHPR